MSGQIQAANFLNTKQLMSISDGINGITEEANASIFSEVSSLDTNTNKTIDKGESAVSKIINLGNVVLNKLASMLGISTDKPAENSKMETFEDAQKDSVIADYFTPYAEAGADATSGSGLASGDLDGMITDANIKYTFDSIVQEKLSQGVKITENNDGHIAFDDGTELSVKNTENGQSLVYTRTAADGSVSNAEITTSGDDEQGSYGVQITTNDANGPSDELLESLLVRNPDGDSAYGEAYSFDDKGMQTINDSNNRESITTSFNYQKNQRTSGQGSTIERSADYQNQHVKNHHSASDAEVYIQMNQHNKNI